MGKIDKLLIPVGWFYTIDAKAAGQISDKLAPRVTMPMHYKTEKCGYPIAGVDEFIGGKDNVRRLDASDLESKRAQLPAITQIIVLKPAL